MLVVGKEGLPPLFNEPVQPNQRGQALLPNHEHANVACVPQVTRYPPHLNSTACHLIPSRWYNRGLTDQSKYR
jgi:hypothetical protein